MTRNDFNGITATDGMEHSVVCAAESPFYIQPDHHVVCVLATIDGTFRVYLPTHVRVGAVVEIVDRTGVASTSPIEVVAIGTDTINAESTFSLAIDFGTARFVFGPDADWVPSVSGPSVPLPAAAEEGFMLFYSSAGPAWTGVTKIREESEDDFGKLTVQSILEVLNASGRTFYVDEDGGVTIPSLAGVEPRTLMVDEDGKLFAV